ncbi:MAG: hypothetical protein IKO74_11365 [Selenomonadaceae bacterium]|nr:hypothetical protein [Selenomonadaceae bacterium]
MNGKFLALIAGSLLTFGKILELFPVITVIANILGGGVADTIFLAENLEEEFA